MKSNKKTANEEKDNDAIENYETSMKENLSPVLQSKDRKVSVFKHFFFRLSTLKRIGP